MTFSPFQLALVQLMETARGSHDTRPIHEQSYWRDIQELRKLAYFEIAALLAEGKTP